MDTLTFGRLLKRLRLERDLTQEVLAEQIGCAVPTLRSLEAGRRRPSRAMAEQIADVLGLASDQRAKFLALARAQPSSVARPRAGDEPDPTDALKPALPKAGNALIGRQAERTALCHLLQEESCRLVTLAGAGGVGKTRLALEVAVTLAPKFHDGAAFVSLGPIESAHNVPPAVLDALGLALAGQVDPRARLLNELATRELLLVLDNFEHLLAGAEDATPFVTDILLNAPQVRLLITSRERLRLSGEQVFELDGLPVPDVAASPDHSAAVQLFVERAQQTSGGFTLTPQNAPAVTRICQLVEGMPLGIELAAVWVHMLTPGEIAQEIEKNIDFLALAQRDAPQRHRNIGAAFDHSWRLLSDVERGVLAKLAVFRGGCQRGAAEAVAGATPAILMSLIDKSLVRFSQTVYDMHELIRQYAAGRLAAAGELEATRDKHLAYYLGLAEAGAPELFSIDQAVWLARWSREYDNVCAALEWAFGAGADRSPQRPEQGMRLAVKLDRYWQGRNHLREGCRWLERGLQHRAILSAAAQAGALNLWGWLINQLGDHAQAASLQRESLNLFRQAGDQAGTAMALDTLGDIAWAENDFEQAQGYYTESLALRRALGDPVGVGLSLYSLGRLHVDNGYLEPAGELLREGLSILEVQQDRRGIALTLNALGRIDVLRGEYARAAAHIRAALRTFVDLGNRVDVVECLEELAAIAGASGQAGRARQLAESAERLRTQIGLHRHTVHLNRVDAELRKKISETAGPVIGPALSLEQAVTLALE